MFINTLVGGLDSWLFSSSNFLTPLLKPPKLFEPPQTSEKNWPPPPIARCVISMSFLNTNLYGLHHRCTGNRCRCTLFSTFGSFLKKWIFLKFCVLMHPWVLIVAMTFKNPKISVKWPEGFLGTQWFVFRAFYYFRFRFFFPVTFSNCLTIGYASFDAKKK